MPNRPVRDKWDYPRKMERHFPIKPRQPIRNSSCHFLSFPNSLIRAKNRFVKNGTANFDRNIPTEISGPPPKVIPNIPVGRNRNGPFHLNSDRNFRNLWHNGKHPICFINCNDNVLTASFFYQPIQFSDAGAAEEFERVGYCSPSLLSRVLPGFPSAFALQSCRA